LYAQSAPILHLHCLIKITLATPWTMLSSLIPNPTTKGQLLLALDDTINPKTGKKIFRAAHLSLTVLLEISAAFPGIPLLIITDSRFQRDQAGNR